MAVTLKAVRQGLVNAIVAQIGGEAQQVSPYVLRQPQMPTIWIRPKPDTPIQYHGSMGVMGVGLEFWVMQVEAFHTGDLQAQMQMDEWLESSGPTSIAAGIEKDITLGGIVQSVTVTDVTVYSEFLRADGTPAFGAAWTVKVNP